MNVMETTKANVSGSVEPVEETFTFAIAPSQYQPGRMIPVATVPNQTIAWKVIECYGKVKLSNLAMK